MSNRDRYETFGQSVGLQKPVSVMLPTKVFGEEPANYRVSGTRFDRERNYSGSIVLASHGIYLSDG